MASFRTARCSHFNVFQTCHASWKTHWKNTGGFPPPDVLTTKPVVTRARPSEATVGSAMLLICGGHAFTNSLGPGHFLTLWRPIFHQLHDLTILYRHCSLKLERTYYFTPYFWCPCCYQITGGYRHTLHIYVSIIGYTNTFVLDVTCAQKCAKYPKMAAPSLEAAK